MLDMPEPKVESNCPVWRSTKSRFRQSGMRLPIAPALLLARSLASADSLVHLTGLADELRS
jgi:hypothetical protein